MSLTMVAVIAVVIVLMIVRRVYGEPVRARRMLLAPLIEMGFGVYELISKGGQLPAGEWALLAVTGVLSLVLGAARGATIDLFPRRGYLWQRYRPRTFAVWAGAFVARFAVRLIFSAVGLTPSLSAALHGGGSGGVGNSLLSTLLITSGLGFLGESMVLAPRALRTGVPWQPAGQGRGGLLGGLFDDIVAGRDGGERTTLDPESRVRSRSEYPAGSGNRRRR